MNRGYDESRTSRRLAWLWLVAGIAIVVCFARERATGANEILIALLAALAVFAELLPVELPRRGVRITFALPFVAAVAVFAGGFAALCIDFLATTFVSILTIRSLPRSTEGKWIAANGAISASSAGLAALALGLVRASGVPTEALVIFFIACYAVVNLTMVVYVEWVLTSRWWSANAMAMVGTAASGFFLYSLVGLLVAVMMHEKLYFAVPLVLVPVWALRTGLGYRARMDEVYYETISALSQMLQRAHPYTHGHLERVSRTAEEVAHRLGLSPKRARLVREAAVLHDIGKIAVNEEVLDKPGKLTPEELTHVRLHAVFGAEILAPVPTFSAIVPWIRHHHERPDGTGYPDSLQNHQIPIESKIIAVVDAYDAMIGDADGGRSYRQPLSEADALDELDRCAGSQFDHAVVRAFRETVSRGKR